MHYCYKTILGNYEVFFSNRTFTVKNFTQSINIYLITNRYIQVLNGTIK